MKPCQFPNGIKIFPNGVDELDPCVYEDIKKFKNVTVVISKCTKCGKLQWSWIQQDDSVELTPEDDDFYDSDETF